jgi:hypothetical protein
VHCEREDAGVSFVGVCHLLGHGLVPPLLELADVDREVVLLSVCVCVCVNM